MVIHFSTADIFTMVSDGTHVTIAIKYEMAYGLKISTYRFDFGPF